MALGGGSGALTGLPLPRNFVQPFSTGASLVYLGMAGGLAKLPMFFGTCEGFPKHQRVPEWQQIRNDVSGRRIPLDMSFQGETALVSLDMTVWDEGMAMRLERLPDMVGTSSSTFAPGSWGFNDVGVLVGLEAMAIPIWVRYPFALSRPACGGLVAGYHYYQAIPVSPITDENGAQGMMRSFNFFVWPVVNFAQQTHRLFDNDMSLTLNVPINGPTAA